MNQNLYERIGGKVALEAAVDLFYEKVLADPRLTPFFAGVDMPRQRAKQKIFLACAFGGPVRYEGKDLREAHRHLDLTDEHFNAVAGHLQETLQELCVPGGLIEEVLALVATTRADVLNR